MQKLVAAENASECVEYIGLDKRYQKGFTCVACKFLMTLGERKGVICDLLVPMPE